MSISIAFSKYDVQTTNIRIKCLIGHILDLWNQSGVRPWGLYFYKAPPEESHPLKFENYHVKPFE